MSNTYAVLFRGGRVHPLAGKDAVRETADLIESLGGPDAVEGVRLVELSPAGQEITDHTEELSHVLSHSSTTYAY